MGVRAACVLGYMSVLHLLLASVCPAHSVQYSPLSLLCQGFGSQGCCKVQSATCAGEQKREKRFLRGRPAPRQRAAPFAIPLFVCSSRLCNSLPLMQGLQMFPFCPRCSPLRCGHNHAEHADQDYSQALPPPASRVELFLSSTVY